MFFSNPRQRDFLDTHIVFRVEFHNYTVKSNERRLMQGPKLPDVTTATFFKVCRDRILSLSLVKRLPEMTSDGSR